MEAVEEEEEQSNFVRTYLLFSSLLRPAALLPSSRSLVPLATQLAASIARFALEHQKANGVEQVGHLGEEGLKVAAVAIN